MNLHDITLEQAAEISIIIAMVCVIFKAFQHPISRVLFSLNPLRLQRRINNIDEKIEKIEYGDVPELHRHVRQIEKEIESLKKGVTAKKK